MKHLKRFDELNKETYLSAANKLYDKGHINRANSLRDYAKDIIVSDDEFSFYRNRASSTVNPKIEVAKITDIDIEKVANKSMYKPNRTFIDKLSGKNKEQIEQINHYDLILVVKFSNGIVYKKSIGVEHLQEFFGGHNEDWLPIIFTTRKDAVKFVNICNDKIKEVGKKHSQYRPVDTTLLNVNDYFRN